MENLTMGAAITTLLAIASAVFLLIQAGEKIIKVWKAAKAPNAKQDNRIDALERWSKEVDRKLSSDNERLAVIDNGNRVTQRALLALLGHGIDGNNTEQMQHAKEELQEYLINR